MEVIATVPEMQRRADTQRAAGRRLALVPTMGALHEGHLSLVRKAREVADDVAVSIYVNPTQFVAGEDLDKYPRPVDEDLLKLRASGADAVFLPADRAMYPDPTHGQLTWVTTDHLGRHLCGRYRDGHFRGVTTVVTKLVNACRPHVALFGLKDAQQFVILKRMFFDLNTGVDILGVPTYREADGLAASSRNIYLSPAERAQAPILHRAIQEAEAAIQAGAADAAAVREVLASRIAEAPDARVQYAEIVDTDALQPVETIARGQEVLVAVAVFFGKTRLIDNAFIVAQG
ncbi:MAG: pantoate--beta-alanine ligase [Rhodothermales bacterium]|nr:pantoate--beta-alanine ligase [Rhodothermales bacterium]